MDRLRRLALVVPLAALAGCAGQRGTPPRWASAALAPLPPLPAPAKLAFAPQYELTRDSGTPWGEGLAFGALWRHDVPDGDVLRGLAIAGDGTVLTVESRKDSYSDAELCRLDASGRTASRAPIRGSVKSLAAGDFGGHPALLAQSDYTLQVLDPSGTRVWAPSATLQKAVLADLDGDGENELVAAMPDYKGIVGAFSADGRELWTRKGFDHVEGLAAGRFGEDRAESIVVFGSVKGVSRVSLLNGKGRTVGSFSDDSVPELGAVLRRAGAATWLVHEGSKYQTEHTRVRISRIEGGRRTSSAEADAGRARVLSLVVADLRGDGRKEIVLGTDNGWLLIYDENARFLAEKHFFGEIRSLAAADLDRNGRQELLVGVYGTSPEVYAFGIVLKPVIKAGSPRGGRK